MHKDKIIITEKTINNTLYVILNMTGEQAKETAYDKAKRLILNDAKPHNTKNIFS